MSREVTYIHIHLHTTAAVCIRIHISVVERIMKLKGGLEMIWRGDDFDASIVVCTSEYDS